jgi:hypothetical protein
MFALSMVANTANDYKGTQSVLQRRLQTELPGIIKARVSGQWEVVWGPVVWKAEPGNSSSGPDNSWFVAYNPSVIFDDGSTHETYVVAIAGTAMTSMRDWETENLEVDKVVDFSAWVASGITQPPVSVNPEDVIPDGTYAAKGTATAVYTLLIEPSPSGAASEGLTLCDFLSGIRASSSTRLVFTGHSLGGALSPTMALALVRSGALHGKVLVYPSAGPSPGNGSFAKLFAQTFPASQTTSSVEYAVWNTNIINSLDIVPQAWCTKPKQLPAQNLDNIPLIYGPPIINFIEVCIFFLKAKADISRTVYIPIQSRILSGGNPTSTGGDMISFLREAVMNHTTFYSKLFGVVVSKFMLKMGDELIEKTESEQFLGYPVIGDIEWGNEHRDEAEAAVAAVRASAEDEC